MTMSILSLVKISPSPECRKEVLDILNSMKGPTQAMQGCLAYHISTEEGDDGLILLLEHWRTWEDFICHIRSELYSRILESMELAAKEPEICFFEVTVMKGMELLEAVRNPK